MQPHIKTFKYNNEGKCVQRKETGREFGTNLSQHFFILYSKEMKLSSSFSSSEEEDIDIGINSSYFCCCCGPSIVAEVNSLVSVSLSSVAEDCDDAE